MIIELFGLPGSGKTYLAEKLEEKDFKLVKFSSKLEKYFYSFLFILSFPLLSIYLFFKLNLNSNKYGNIKIKIMRNILLFATMAFYKKASLSKDKIILDEGFFQMINSIFEAKKQGKKIF